MQALLDAKVGAAKDACMAISTEATQEAALEELLAKVTAKWAGIEFCVIPYKDSKDVYILGALDEIQVRWHPATLVCTLCVRLGRHAADPDIHSADTAVLRVAIISM